MKDAIGRWKKIAGRKMKMDPFCCVRVVRTIRSCNLEKTSGLKLRIESNNRRVIRKVHFEWPLMKIGLFAGIR